MTLLQFILGILLYVLGCVCVTAVAGIFGVLVTFSQAAALLILLTIVVAIIKNS